MIDETLSAQGTKLRILAAAVVAATAAVAGGTVTMTKVAHGRKVGDRVYLPAVSKVVTIATVPSADTFTFAQNGFVLAVGPQTYQLFETIAAKDFNGPGGSAAVLDATTLLSTSKEKRLGIRDEGQISFNVFFKPDNPAQMELRAARATRAAVTMELEFTDGTIWTYDGYVLQFSVQGAVDGLVEGSVSVEITGDILES